MYKATTDQIEAWKKEHETDEIFAFKSVKHDKQAYYRKPKRKELSFISQIKDGSKFNEKLLQTCYLGGDKEIETNDDIFLGLGDKIIAILKYAEVEVEKL